MIVSQPLAFSLLRGTAMGVSFAPCYANLTLGWREESLIWRNNTFAAHIVLYGWYMDYN